MKVFACCLFSHFICIDKLIGSIDLMSLFYKWNFSGLFLVAFSIIFGIETAKGFRWLLNKLNMCSGSGNSMTNCRVDSSLRQLAAMVMFLVMLGILWGVSGALVKAKFKHGGSAAELWFGCMVGPVGVWIRWFLARLNGRGLGRAGLFKWIPFGTLIANVSAACIMAALSSVKSAVSFFVTIRVPIPPCLMHLLISKLVGIGTKLNLKVR